MCVARVTKYMSLVIAKEDLGKAILAVNITAKLKVLFTLYIISKMECLVLKVGELYGWRSI